MDTRRLTLELAQTTYVESSYILWYGVWRSLTRYWRLSILVGKKVCESWNCSRAFWNTSWVPQVFETLIFIIQHRLTQFDIFEPMNPQKKTYNLLRCLPRCLLVLTCFFRLIERTRSLTTIAFGSTIPLAPRRIWNLETLILYRDDSWETRKKKRVDWLAFKQGLYKYKLMYLVWCGFKMSKNGKCQLKINMKSYQPPIFGCDGMESLIFVGRLLMLKWMSEM